MGKKLFLIFGVMVILVGGYYFYRQRQAEPPVESQCRVGEMVYYYLPTCPWCQQVKREGTIDKVKQLGVKVKEVNVSIGPVRHQFQGVPTFVVEGKVYSGYHTFDQVKELLACES